MCFWPRASAVRRLKLRKVLGPDRVGVQAAQRRVARALLLRLPQLIAQHTPGRGSPQRGRLHMPAPYIHTVSYVSLSSARFTLQSSPQHIGSSKAIA